MKLILAHAARGFNMYHTIEAIHTLAGLDNVYFDTGAICEAGAITACIRAFGAKKVLYGSGETRVHSEPPVNHPSHLAQSSTPLPPTRPY